jgi:hypothetical protein
VWKKKKLRKLKRKEKKEKKKKKKKKKKKRKKKKKKKNRYAWQKHQTAYLINVAIPNRHNQFSIITNKL